MLSFTTRHRTFDYLQLRWLEKTSGRPSHEWDLYIIKELLDNALDADERQMYKQGERVELTIDLTYHHVATLDIHSLDIGVANQALFPTDLLPTIFDLNAYTSNKSHYNYPTRGHQGNALKTILGIPYALRHFGYGDYANIRKPLVIESGDLAYVISFEIDETFQQVQLAPLHSIPLRPPRIGTCFRVGIDRFVQEQPRTMADLHIWAQRFALFNPHVTFHWRIRLGEQAVAWDFLADPSWRGLYMDSASAHWYEYTQMRELLLALERDLGAMTPLSRVLQSFAGFTPAEDPNGRRAMSLCEHLGYQTLADLRLTSEHTQTLRNGLWPALLREGQNVSAEQLGGLKESHLIGMLTRYFSLEMPPLYRRLVNDDPSDPAHPFVLELALARLPAGSKRLIWTGLNHTPAYEDPFFTRQLYPPIKQSDSVFGLDGFLDAYGQTTEQPVLLVMHLICPNLAFQDFSKTAIETRPFRDPLAAALHEMLTTFNRVQTIHFEDLQPDVHALMPRAINVLSPGGQRQFTTSQLLRAVRRLLSDQLRVVGRVVLAETWLGDLGADARLQGYIQTYVHDHPEVLANLIQPERGRISLPVHPERHTTLLLSQIDQRMLDEACLNKILLVTDPELEAVIVANGLLARFDIALLRIDASFDDSFEALLPHLDRLRLPLALLHHATPADCLLPERLRTQLDDAGLKDIPLHDLGLTPAQGRRLDLPPEPGPGGGDRTALERYLDADEITFLVDHRQQMSLLALTVEEMISWLDERFAAIGLPPKLVPEETHLRAMALSAIRKTLTDWILERFHEVARADYLADRAIHLLAADLRVDDITPQVHQHLHDRPCESWRLLWDELTDRRCQEVLASHDRQLNELIYKHVQDMAATSHLKK